MVMGRMASKLARGWRENPYPPLVIGGTGGSGTRTIRDLVHRAGVFMGVRLNDSNDALDFVPFLDEYINRLLQATGTVTFDLDALASGLRDEALSDFRNCLRTYQGELPRRQRWGWKNPRSIYILPVIHHCFPAMQFIHVVRDGRDMALSANQNQLFDHYDALFGHGARKQMGAIDSARLWMTVNSQVAAWGEAALGDRYLRIRFEDLCARPTATAGKIIDAFDLPNKDADAAATGVITRPPTVGRWRQAEPDILDGIVQVARPALERLGYL